MLSQITSYGWAASQGKVVIMRSSVPNEDARIRTSYGMYLLLKGPNTFFAPKLPSPSTDALPPSAYSQMRGVLGDPVAPLASEQESGSANAGFRLYWRECEGGVVYLNWTGADKTIVLPVGPQYFDSQGNAVKQITIPDMMADYVLYNRGARSDRPQINPRFSGEAAAPLALTVNTTDNSTVYYTLDGVEPSKSSSVYSTPLSTQSATVLKARTGLATAWSSFVSEANYKVVPAVPEVQFVTARDAGAAGRYYPVVALNRIASWPVSVAYAIEIPNRATARGTISFQPGDRYRTLPVDVPGYFTAETVVTLSAPSGAVLGSTSIFRYAVR